MNHVTLRNTLSGKSAVFSPRQAAHILANKHLGAVHVVVNTSKPEVLSQPYEVTPDGDRIIADREDAPSGKLEGEELSLDFDEDDE